LERFRDLIVIAAVPDGAGAILHSLPADQVDRMRQQAAAFGAASLSRAADIVNAGLTEMTGATSPRGQLEVIAARVLLPGAEGESGYAARLDRLERRMDVGGTPSEGGAPRSEGPGPTPRVGASKGGGPTPTQAPAPSHTPVPPTPVQSAPEPPEESTPPAQPATRPEPTGPAVQPEPAHDEPAPPEPAPEQESPDHEPAAQAPTATMDVEVLRRSWPDVLGRIYQMRRATWTFLSEHAQVLSYDGQRLVLGI